jgi:tetratricopeptide (TPR) repeat protein
VNKRSTQEPRERRQDKTQRRLQNLLRQGTEALQKGEVARAIHLLERAQRLDKENKDTALNLGGAYILSKAFQKAITVLEPLSANEPNNPMVWTNLGAAYLGNPVLAQDADQQRAIAAFQRAIELNPATPHVAYNLGLIYRDRQETDRALYWFQRAVQVNPNDRDARRYVEKLSQEKSDPDRTAETSG